MNRLKNRLKGWFKHPLPLRSPGNHEKAVQCQLYSPALALLHHHSKSSRLHLSQAQFEMLHIVALFWKSVHR